MPTPDGAIDSRNLCSQAVVERVLGDEAVTSIKIYNTIQSDNYSAGSAGWQINRVTGSCEFQDATIRGTLNASDINAGTMSASYLGAGTIGVHVIKLSNSSSSRIESNDGTSLIIRGDGTFVGTSVTITGAVTATSGDLGALTVSGTLTMVSGGGVKTVSTGARLEITQSSATLIDIYNSSNALESRIGFASTAGAIVTSEISVRLIGGSGDVTTDYFGDSAIDLPGSNQYEIRFYTNGNNERTTITNTGLVSATTLGYHLRHAAGSAATPTFSFVDDTDTGMFRAAANTLAWSLGTTEKMRLTTTGLEKQTTGAPHIRFTDAGSASTPAYSFYGDTDTGMYRHAADNPAIAAGGRQAAIWTAPSTTESRMYMGSGLDDYIGYDNSPAQWELVVNGTQEFLLGTSGIYIPNVYNTDQAGGSTVYADSGGRLHINTSTLRYKTNVKPAPEIADIQLVPISFTKNGVPDLSFAAEWLTEQDTRLGVWDEDGEVLDFRDRAVLAVLAAKINRLEELCPLN